MGITGMTLYLKELLQYLDGDEQVLVYARDLKCKWYKLADKPSSVILEENNCNRFIVVGMKVENNKLTVYTTQYFSYGL